jgi:arginase
VAEQRVSFANSRSSNTSAIGVAIVKNQFVLTPFALDARDNSMDRLARPDWIVNAPALDEDETMARMGRVHRGLAALVERAIADGRRPVSIGGDCCQAIAVMAGLRRAGLDPVLVWLDAHGDFNTWDTSPSGFIGGMPLAMLVGRGEQTLLQQLGLPPMADHNVVLCDARDLDSGERVSLHSSRVTHVTRAEELVRHVPPDRPLYVHFDADIIDAADAPAMLYPVERGPTAATMREIADQLRQTNRVAAVSVTPWALDRDPDGRTERACLTVLDTLVG